MWFIKIFMNIKILGNSSFSEIENKSGSMVGGTAFHANAESEQEEFHGSEDESNCSLPPHVEQQVDGIVREIFEVILLSVNPKSCDGKVVECLQRLGDCLDVWIEGSDRLTLAKDLREVQARGTLLDEFGCYLLDQVYEVAQHTEFRTDGFDYSQSEIKLMQERSEESEFELDDLD